MSIFTTEESAKLYDIFVEAVKKDDTTQAAFVKELIEPDDLVNGEVDFSSSDIQQKYIASRIDNAVEQARNEARDNSKALEPEHAAKVEQAIESSYTLFGDDSFHEEAFQMLEDSFESEVDTNRLEFILSVTVDDFFDAQ